MTWAKGQSGNPAGLFKPGQTPGPGRKSLRTLIHEEVTDEDWRLAIRKRKTEALKHRGKDAQHAFELLANRRDGMPSQPLEHTGPGGAPMGTQLDLRRLSDEELEALRGLIEKATPRQEKEPPLLGELNVS